MSEPVCLISALRSLPLGKEAGATLREPLIVADDELDDSVLTGALRYLERDYPHEARLLAAVYREAIRANDERRRDAEELMKGFVVTSITPGPSLRLTGGPKGEK